MGSCEYDMTDSVKKDLKEMNVDSVIIEWLLEAWSQLPKENITKLFKCCGLSLVNDGMEDDFIHCLKKGQPCKTGRKKLNSKLSILVDERDSINPFISLSNEEDAKECDQGWNRSRHCNEDL